MCKGKLNKRGFIGVIIIAAVSTVALLILAASYYYQYHPANLGRNLLGRFNVTNETDKFGTFKIYRTAKNGETWFFNSADPNDGDWGDDMTRCGANASGAVISWASPMVIFKSTYVAYDFAYLSVREIQPFK